MGSQTYVNSTTLTDAAEFNRFDTAAYPVLSGVAGTNTITATGPANYSLSSALPPVYLTPANTNTGATTLNITPSGSSALTAKNVFRNGAACVGGELVAGVPVALSYDGTQFNILGVGPRFKIIGLTRDLTAASGDVSYTGAGFKPSTVVFFAGGPSSLVGGGSWGMDDGTNHKAIVAVAATPGAFASDTSHSISIFETAGTAGQQAIVKTFDTDGFTLTWTKTGSPSTGTNQIYALCLR